MDEVLLEIKNLHKSFGNNKIHQGIDLKLLKGETIGLLGGSGTGKSVLLRSIIGLERINHGEIFFNHTKIDNLSEQQLFKFRLKISYSFQNGALFDSLNVFENIAYPLFEHSDFSLNEIDQKVKEMLALIDLEGKELLMPSDLSGGMQKRVGMARSIIMNPEIILYDEPTAGLDPTNTVNILNLMKKLKNRGHSSIFVTHDIPAALSLCDKIIVLNEGKVFFNGTPLEFKNSKDELILKFFTLSHLELKKEDI